MTHNLFPSRADLFAWLGNTDTGTAGDVYDLALEVAAAEQAVRCTWDYYTPELHAAGLRRAARFLAARGLALGRIDGGEFGPTVIPRWDSEINSYEANYLSGSFA